MKSSAPHGGFEETNTTDQSIAQATGRRYFDPGSPTYGLMGATEAATAEVFAANALDSFRFAAGLGWLAWDGLRWARATREYVQYHMGCMVRSAIANSLACTWQFADNADWKTWTHRAATKSHLLGAITFAQQQMAIDPEALDAHPHLINLPNGTLNLETGDLQTHQPSDYITKLAGANFDPKATSEDVNKWLAALGADKRREYLLRLLGSTLHGANSRDEKLVLLRGGGGTGKGTYLAVAAGVLGEYAASVASELLTERSQNPTGGRPELLDLRGARLIFASETGDDAQFAAPLVKALTGRDEIVARALHSNSIIKFVASGKLFVATNFAPKTNAYDSGMQRRLQVIPFEAVPDDLDVLLKARLRADANNLSAALNLMLKGCQRWLKCGLQTPDNTTAQATDQYWADQDVAGSFVTEVLDLSSTTARLAGADLHAAFRVWCQDAGKQHGPKLQGDLTRVLLARGVCKIRPGNVAVYIGVKFKLSDGGKIPPKIDADVGGSPGTSEDGKTLSRTQNSDVLNEDVGASEGLKAQNPLMRTCTKDLLKGGVTAPTFSLEVQA